MSKSLFQGTLFDILVDTCIKTLNSLLASTLFLPLFCYRGKGYMIRGIFPNPIGILDQIEGLGGGEELTFKKHALSCIRVFHSYL